MSHAERVAAVCAAVRDAPPGRLHIAKGGVHHFVPRPGDGRFAGRAVDVSALTAVLEVDVAARTCTAEPGATFADVVRRTLRDGLLPKVVPELQGITLGGAVAGCSVESMSYRYGGFHDTCLAYEVVDGTGARRELARGDTLFELIHGSYGTLAILTRVTFELVEAAPFVTLTYHHHATFDAFMADLRERCAAADFDFVDGIVHAPDHLVLCLGRFAETAPRAPSDYGPTGGVFYRSTGRLERDWMTTFDYCFRYDADCHWLSRTAPPLEWRPVRRALGRRVLGSENLITWSGRLGPALGRVQKRPDVVVDVFIPARRLAEFWAWYAEVFDYWPLWIVPYRVDEPYAWIDPAHGAGLAGELMIDCAVYGKRNTGPRDLSALLEAKTYELGGIKTLISENHHTEERFWSVYNRPAWEAAKAELDPGQHFAGLYEKFH